MRILVACEESQVLCNELRKRGHEAYSCDIVPTRGDHPEWHIQMDVLDVIYKITADSHLGWPFSQDGAPIRIHNWDAMFAFPECRFLANSGVRWLYNPDGTKNTERWKQMEAAATFFKKLLYAPILRIAIENPVMHKYGREAIGVGPGQVIQPWWFGNPNKKATGLYLKNLPALTPTKIVPEKDRVDTVHRMPPSETRSRDRAVTFKEVAEAMADQWGSLP
jgi:hypothetical protein